MTSPRRLSHVQFFSELLSKQRLTVGLDELLAMDSDPGAATPVSHLQGSFVVGCLKLSFKWLCRTHRVKAR